MITTVFLWYKNLFHSLFVSLQHQYLRAAGMPNYQTYLIISSLRLLINFSAHFCNIMAQTCVVQEVTIRKGLKRKCYLFEFWYK
jgi:hypothetical protein